MKFFNAALRIFLILAWLVPAKSIMAQEPQLRNIRKAKDLKEEFEDNEFYSYKSTVEYKFEYTSKKKEAVQAVMQSEEKLITLEDDESFIKSIFFDNTTEVDNARYFLEDIKKAKTAIRLVSSYQSGGIFHSDAQLAILGTRSMELGNSFTFEFEKTYSDLRFLTKAYFHEQYPIQKKELIFTVPKWMEVEFVEMNFEGYEIDKRTRTNSDGTKSFIYKIEDIEGRKQESNAPSMAKIFPHIMILVKSYELQDKEVELFAEMDDLYGWYKELVDDLDNNADTLKPLVEKLTKDVATDFEKMENIFYWVQDNIRYIAFEDGIAGYQPDAADEVYRKLYGDCKGMANLLKQMLTIAGLDARMTWMGTRHIPYNYSIPSLAVDNHAICTVFLDGKRYFLDATETFIGVGYYAHRIQGQDVMIEDGTNFIIDTIPTHEKERNLRSVRIDLELTPDNILRGIVKSKIYGQEKTDVMAGYSYTAKDDREEALRYFFSRGNKNIKIDSLNVINLEDRKEAIEAVYEVSLKHHVQSFDDEYYINLSTMTDFMDSDFDSTRIYDYEFSYKLCMQDTLTLSIPKDMKVDYLPEAVNIQCEDFHISASFTEKGGQVYMIKKITIDNAILHSENFDLWNEGIEKLSALYREYVVLIKK